MTHPDLRKGTAELIWVALGGLVLAGLVGCVNLPDVIQTYPGPARTRAEHGVVEVNQEIENLGIAEIDGKVPLSYCGKSGLARGTVNRPILLLPGRHEIILSFSASDIIARRWVEVKLTAPIEAGHTYIAQFKGDRLMGECFFWIEEKDTRKVICKGGRLFSDRQKAK
jgi:hypothetical protein